jgi:hypothetical protein
VSPLKLWRGSPVGSVDLVSICSKQLRMVHQNPKEIPFEMQLLPSLDLAEVSEFSLPSF